jgi:hypothetical protein
MEFLSLFLIFYGIIVSYLVLTKASIVFNNPKVKLFKKWLGEKGTYYFLLVFGLLSMIAGIILQFM